MQKLLLLITFSLTIYSSNAQLSALKAKRDAVNEAVQEGSADNTNGYTMVSNLKTVFVKKIFKVQDYTVEGVNDAVAKSVMISSLEKSFMNTTWNFFEGDFLYFTQSGSTTQNKFSINSNTVDININNQLFKATVYNNGNKYRFVGNIPGINAQAVLLMEGRDKVGDETLTATQLAKQSFTYLASNGDYYKTETYAIYQWENDSWFLEPQKNNNITIYHLNRSQIYGDNHLEVFDIDLSNIEINNFKVAYTEWNSSLPLFISNYGYKQYKNKEQSENNTQSKKIIIPVGYFSCEEANYLLEKIAAFLPASLRATFKATSAKRKSDLSVRKELEKKEQDRIAAERAKEAEHFVTVTMTSNSYAPAVIAEQPTNSNGGRCSYATYKFERSSTTGNAQTKTITFCKGSVVKNITNGQVLFTATPDMRGKSIQF